MFTNNESMDIQQKIVCHIEETSPSLSGFKSFISLQSVLVDCVKLAIESVEFPNYMSSVETIFKCIGTGLDNPFNQAIRHVIMTIAVCFEVSIIHLFFALH